MRDPQPQRSGRRGLVIGLTTILGVLLVVLGVLIVQLVRDRSGDTGSPVLTAPVAEPAGPVPDADPTSGRGTQNFRDSWSFAEAFVQRLVERDPEAAYAVLCEASRGGVYPDPEALQRRFDVLARGMVAEIEAINAVGTAGTDYVSMYADLVGGASASLTVVIEEEDGHLAVCAIEGDSAGPTY